jgi:hypothetical protein
VENTLLEKRHQKINLRLQAEPEQALLHWIYYNTLTSTCFCSIELLPAQAK